MKKMLSVALSALLAASLMACGGGSAKGTETKAAQTEAGSETKEAKERVKRPMRVKRYLWREKQLALHRPTACPHGEQQRRTALRRL